jgi:4-amino-4-deoxy-L-arabinose transferase-like glycosyltransferase
MVRHLPIIRDLWPSGPPLKNGKPLQTDLAFYLDHPEAFSRFYIVARAYSALWGLLGVAVVYRLGREWTGQFLVGATAAGLFASMPVVIDLAHEAKPHLAGTVLILLTIYAAMRYVRTGILRWWMIAGAAAGASMGMVLTGYVAFAVLPAMALLRQTSWKDRAKITLGSGLVGIAIFTLTNPYLPLNVLFHRELLHSNVGNYGTFYQPRLSVSALTITGRSIVEGMSLAPAVVGMLALVVLSVVGGKFIRDTGRRPVSQFGFGLLLVAPAAVVLVQMILLAQEKTAEYARFGLFTDTAIALTAAALIGSLGLKAGEKRMLALLLVGGTLFYGVRYDINFVLDSGADSTRRTAAESIDTCSQRENELAVWAEPAPYCLPPVDLFTWRIVLLPAGSDLSGISPGAIAVRPVDYPTTLPIGIRRFTPQIEYPRPFSPISWANKPF